MKHVSCYTSWLREVVFGDFSKICRFLKNRRIYRNFVTFQDSSSKLNLRPEKSQSSNEFGLFRNFCDFAKFVILLIFWAWDVFGSGPGSDQDRAKTMSLAKFWQGFWALVRFWLLVKNDQSPWSILVRFLGHFWPRGWGDCPAWAYKNSPRGEFLVPSGRAKVRPWGRPKPGLRVVFGGGSGRVLTKNDLGQIWVILTRSGHFLTKDIVLDQKWRFWSKKWPLFWGLKWRCAQERCFWGSPGKNGTKTTHR